jgi:hypothetical protein
MKAGQLSQAGIILEMTLRSLVERHGYDEADFCRRMDEELFPRLNGEPMSGPGGYTSQSQTSLDPATGTGWTLNGVGALNNAGQIACAATRNGVVRAVLLTPVVQ